MAASTAHLPFDSSGSRAEARSDGRDIEVRTQLALIRTLIDEIRRQHAGVRGSALIDQLEAEIVRLAGQMSEETPSPPSGIRLHA